MRRVRRRWVQGRMAVTFAVLALGPGATAAGAAPFVYVSNQLSDNVSQYAAGPTGALTPLTPPAVAAPTFPQEGVTVSPDGRNLYVTAFQPGFTGGAIRQYDIAPDGTLSPKSPPSVPAGDSPRLAAVTPDGRSVYVADFTLAARVLQYDRGPGGALTPKQPPAVAAGRFTFGVAVSPDGRSVYATNFDLGQSSVSQYDVGAGGALTPKTPATVPSGNGPDGIAVSPDGRSVYVANFREDLQGRPGAISQYDVGAGGRLAPKTPAKVVTLGFMRHVAVAPDGRSVYVTDTNNGVHQFDVGAGGRLAPKSPSSVAAGTTPVGLAISPDGRSVYVANTGSDDVSQLDVGPSGALSPKTPARVPAGDTPAGVATTPAAQRPRTKDDCKDGGWRRFGFRNQGQCVAFVNRGPKP